LFCIHQTRFSTERLVAEAARHHGICYIRTTRPKTAALYSNDEQFPIGKSKVVRQSQNDRATVVAGGITVHEALKAASTLAAEGIAIRIVDAYSVKPIDAEGFLRLPKLRAAESSLLKIITRKAGSGKPFSKQWEIRRKSFISQFREILDRAA
jgi:transketolase